MYQGAVAKFDKKTEKFQTWSLPPKTHKATHNQSDRCHALQGGLERLGPRCRHVFPPRLDPASWPIRSVPAISRPSPNIYDVISGLSKQAYFTVFGPIKSEGLMPKTRTSRSIRRLLRIPRAAPRAIGLARPLMVRRISRQIDWHVDTGDAALFRSGCRQRHGPSLTMGG